MNVADFSDETKQWRANADLCIAPYDAAFRNGTLVLTVVKKLAPRPSVDDNIAGEGEVHWRVVETIRPRKLTLTSRAAWGRAEFDPGEQFVKNGHVQVKINMPEPHPERATFPERDITCRFKVTKSGSEQIETTPYGFSTELVSRFYAETTDHMPASAIRGDQAPDVLVITALKDECDAFMRVMKSSVWIKGKDGIGLPYYQTVVPDASGVERVVIVSRAADMGESPATSLAERLIGEFGKPKVLAMSGICAGHPTETSLGDVVVANRLFKFDEGKREVVKNAQSGLDETTIFRDVATYHLDVKMKVALEDFAQHWKCSVPTMRPKSYEHQLRYLLWTLEEMGCTDKKLDDFPECRSECALRGKVIDRAVECGLVTASPTLRLTELGRTELRNERDRYGLGRRVDLTEPAVKIGGMGTSAMVQKDPQLFYGLQRVLRGIRAVDMEAAAVGMVAHHHAVPFLVVKSVVDYADMQKNDNFRYYSSETSAHFLMSFLMTCGLEIGLWKPAA